MRVRAKPRRPAAAPSPQAGRADQGLPSVCVLAGGLGTRLGSRVRDTPKPLLEVAGEPFLLHLLRLLAAHRAREVVLCVGYLGELIERRVGRERFGVQVRYSHDSAELDGTLGAVRRALPLLGERFLVLNGDTYLPIDYRAAASGWQESGLPALMGVVHRNDCHEAPNAEYAGGRVFRYDKTAKAAMEWVDCGLGGFERGLIERLPPGERDLPALFAQLASDGSLYGFVSPTRYYEIGTPEGLAETDAFLRSHVPIGR